MNIQNESLFSNRYVIRTTIILLALASLFFASKFMSEVKSYQYIGSGAPATNTIYVSGQGEVFSVPDIATITFSVRESGKTVADTQKEVSKKIEASLSFLRSYKIDDKDIKTVSYNAYPKYDYANGFACTPEYCPPRKQVLSGYEVMETISVKIRDTEKVGRVLDGIAAAGITDVSGPDFSIDDQDILKAEARKLAIADARQKASTLARDLGVNLVRIVNFSESSNYPMYYSAKAMEDGTMAGGMGGAPTPSLPKGENKITSNVTITYEIR